MQRKEEIEQTHLFLWAFYESSKYPELKNMFAIPNGGKRSKSEAARLKASGVKAGVPDIFLAVARNGYHGLFIEMKVGMNKPTENQVEMMEELTAQGYLCRVCWSGDDAIDAIKEYLGI